MNQVSNADFLKEETLEILDDCWVSGKVAKKGSQVKVSGNDKMQLLASHKAKRKEEEVKK